VQGELKLLSIQVTFLIMAVLQTHMKNHDGLFSFPVRFFLKKFLLETFAGIHFAHS